MRPTKLELRGICYSVFVVKRRHCIFVMSFLVEFEYTLIYDSLPNTGPIDFFKEIQKSVFFVKMNVFKTVGNLLKPDIVGKVLEKIHGR